jgi:hypothetical protein
MLLFFTVQELRIPILSLLSVLQRKVIVVLAARLEK